MNTTMIVAFSAAIVLIIAGILMLLKRIKENTELMQQCYYNLVSDIADAINEMTTFKDDLDYAISRLPKSRSKKVIENTMATNDTLQDILNENAEETC